MKKIYNFSAGPSMLPQEVLREAGEEMLNYKGSGMSVMEISHRSRLFEDILHEAKEDLRKLASIPDDYEILFLQGGAHQQFAMVPMNLSKNKKAEYIITGQWAKRAYQEALRYTDAKALASGEEVLFSYIPDCSDLEIREDADYVHICENNTIYGTKFKSLPNTKGKPLVADLSSCFLSEPIEIRQYALIYAGAQKNFGPAGVTAVIIRKDLIREEVPEYTPTMLRYKTHADAGSLYNTPPCYGIYICGKVFRWILGEGGLEEMKRRNEKKASLLYEYLDQSSMFEGTVRKCDRSLMNIPFVSKDEERDRDFIQAAKEAGFLNLKGHRSVGGMRASIYNAMPFEGVKSLTEFMSSYEKSH